MESGDVSNATKPLVKDITFAVTHRPTLAASRLPVIIVVNTLQQGVNSTNTNSKIIEGKLKNPGQVLRPTQSKDR